MIGLIHALLLAHAAGGATIQGTVRVVGSLQPVPNASVAVAALARTVVADAKGYFVIADVPAGTWEIRATAPGYAGNTVTVVTAETGTIRLDFELELRPIELDPVEVEAQGTAASSGSPSRAPPSAGPPAARVSGSSIKAQPGLIEADVLRALQVLPSVTAMSDFSTALYVRGGAADQNLITLDGIPLFNPYHVGGIFSAIGADAVLSVDVWAGAFPAPSAGDRLSSVVQIHTREGGRDQVRTSGALGLLSAHTTVDGPLGSDGSFLFSGRRTYIDAVSDAAYGLGVIDNTMPYGFSDAYLKATHGVGALGTLTLSGYLDLESVNMPDRMRRSMRGDVQFAWGARMLALGYRRPLGGSLLLEARAGYSGFKGDFDAWEHQEQFDCQRDPPCEVIGVDTTQVIRAHTTSRDLIAAADLTWYGRDHTVRFGAQVDGYLFDHRADILEDVEIDLVPLFSLRSRPTTFAAYVEDRWAVTGGLDVRAGLRLLDAGSLGRAWMPRIGIRWQATPRLALSAGGGSYAQAMRSLRNDESVLSSFIAYDLIASQPDTIGLSRADDVVLGGEWSDDNTLIRVDGYARRLRGLVVPYQADDPMDAPVIVTDSFRIGTGRAHGVELSAMNRRGIAELSLAYAFSIAEIAAADDVFHPRFERRHQLDIGASLTWPRTALSARLALGTGQPYTEQIGLVDHRYIDPRTGDWSLGAPRFVRGEHNGARLPGYLRLDIAARRSYEKRWFGQNGVLTPYVQILNVLNTRNVLIGEADSFGRPELSYLPQLPFLPTFGIEWRF